MAIKNIYVYDFDETICLFQTPEDFIDYCIRDSFFRRFLSSIFKNWLIKRLIKSLGYSKKKLLILTMYGMLESDILSKAKTFYENMIKPNLNPKILERLKLDSEHGEIIIISGGF